MLGADPAMTIEQARQKAKDTAAAIRLLLFTGALFPESRR
jgi:hypothetical protein